METQRTAGSRTSARKAQKIAICFFGITRNFRRYTLDSINRMLVTPIARVDPAFKRFAHFNLIDSVCNPRTGEQNVTVDAPGDYEELHCDAINTTIQTRLDADPQFQENFEKLKSFGDSWGDGFNSLRNCLRQLHSLERVTELLARSGEEFDIVIYSRVDLYFKTNLRIPKIRPRTLYTPWFDKYRGLNDRFAIGDQRSMFAYGRRSSLALRYCEETGKSFHAERFLWWYARQQKLSASDLTSFEFCRVRASGKFVCPDTTATERFRYWFKRVFRRFRRLG
jgi:hypothetical protein